MKEFEKWWKNNNEFCHNKSGQFSKEDAKDVWKAALECMLNGEEDYCSFRQCVLADKIEKELNEM